MDKLNIVKAIGDVMKVQSLKVLCIGAVLVLLMSVGENHAAAADYQARSDECLAITKQKQAGPTLGSSAKQCFRNCLQVAKHGTEGRGEIARKKCDIYYNKIKEHQATDLTQDFKDITVALYYNQSEGGDRWQVKGVGNDHILKHCKFVELADKSAAVDPLRKRPGVHSHHLETIILPMRTGVEGLCHITFKPLYKGPAPNMRDTMGR